MIPLCLVTGFLGSGKTTLLRQIASRYPERRLVFLVNELAAVNVDGRRLAQEGRAVETVLGGSIFCQCRAADFIKILRKIPGRQGTSGNPADGVIVETSGIADPAVFQKMLRDSGLETVYETASVIAVAAPGRFLKLLPVLPNLRAQIETANTVIINKTDLAAPGETEKIEVAVRGIKPGIRIFNTTYARAPADVFTPWPAEKEGETKAALAVSPNPYTALEIPLPGGINLEKLRRELDDFGEDCFRLKGYAVADGKAVYIDYTPEAFRAEPAESGHEMNKLVLIVPDAAEERALALRERIRTEGSFE